MAKERIDILLVEKGFFETREKAKRAIMAGLVRDDYDIIDKPGTKIDIDSNLFVKGDVLPYVSRGGLKLEKAIKQFDLKFENRVIVDIGSSTGGFTDCSLQHGAKLVYAIDVGTNQLVWKLRNDPRVISKEKTNFRYATSDLFEFEQPTIAVIDVSFISLKLIFQPLSHIMQDNDFVVALIKPQFEAGKEAIGKKGIIKDKETHISVIENVIQFSTACGFQLKELSFSPITGGTGNIEFLGLFVKSNDHSSIDITEVVDEAHTIFQK